MLYRTPPFTSTCFFQRSSCTLAPSDFLRYTDHSSRFSSVKVAWGLELPALYSAHARGPDSRKDPPLPPAPT